MNRKRIADRGQVLIIFVFAIVGLIGITGLAIDGGNIYSDRRHAQNAADTAALAAAVVRVHAEQGIHDGTPGYNGWGDCTDVDSNPSTCGSHVINAALDIAEENGYISNVTNSTIRINIPPTEGPYHVGDGSFDPYDYVEVIIDTNVNTFFARVLGVPQLHNHVEATARARYEPESGLYGGNALVALKPGGTDCSGDFDLGGASSVSLYGAGVFVNSNNACAAFKEESSCVTLNFYVSTPPTYPSTPAYDQLHHELGALDAHGDYVLFPIVDYAGNEHYLQYPVYDQYGQLQATGGIQGVPGGGSQTSSCPNAPILLHTSAPVPFPPEPIFDEPAECGEAPVGNFTNGSGYDVLHPGHYASLPPAKNTYLRAGVYCIDNLIKVTNPQSHLAVYPGDDGVMLYIRNGGAFDFQGGTMNLWAITDEHSPYKGYLIYLAHDFTNWSINANAPNCQINGNSDSTFTGTIYAPYCDVTINGTSENLGIKSQIIAYTITLSGSTALEFYYNQDDMGTNPEVVQTGLYH